MAFAAFRAQERRGITVDKDPGAYVSQAEAGVAEPGGSAADGDGDGSLGIGGLRRCHALPVDRVSTGHTHARPEDMAVAGDALAAVFGAT